MKKIVAILIFCTFTIVSYAQVKLDDFGRIILNTYLPDNITISSESKNLLISKLNQITSDNGMGGNQSNPRFIISVNVNIGSKDIIAGPPQMIAQNFDITLFVGDAITNTIFSNTTIGLKGVGTNENKAFIDAIKNINSKNKNIVTFLEEGKSKIINYYNANCDFIINDAQTLVKQQKYDEAIYQLTLVPEVCEICYFKCLDTLSNIYQQKIDEDGNVKFNQAKVIWAATQNPTGAEKTGDILSTINPMATCQFEVTTFMKLIEDKLKAEEKSRWQFKMKQYADKIAVQKEEIRIAEEKGKRDDIYRENQSQREAITQEKQSTRNFELDKIRINSYREVAIEQAKNQPKTVSYNNIYWR